VHARCYSVAEVSGLIIMWFSEHGHAPTWQMPEQEHWGDEGWLGYYERRWNVRVHVQDLVENIPDTTHFVSVHHLPEYPQAKARTEGHIYHQVMGDGSYALRHAAYGLGLTWLNVDAPLRYKFLVAGTPIDEQFLDLRLLFLIYAPGETELPKQGHSILRTIEKNTSLDVNIWSHKAYRDRPPLVAGDGPIGVMRKWAKQFYETT
jgi:hypothetical protein